MYFGRVVGCVWATIKHPDLEGQRMLVVQPLTPELRETGKRLVCLDCTGAGAGELVYWVRGKEATFPFLPKEPPADTTIVGIVDEVHVKRGPGAGGRGPGEGGSLRSQLSNKETRAKRVSSPRPPAPGPRPPSSHPC